MRPRLKMRAWTERQGAATNPYNTGGDWADVLIEEPCDWWVSSGQEQIDPQRAVAIAGEHVLFDRGVDVQAEDRIRRLVDHEGRVIWDSATAAGLGREVEHVAVRPDHLDATLRSTS